MCAWYDKENIPPKVNPRLEKIQKIQGEIANNTRYVDLAIEKGDCNSAGILLNRNKSLIDKNQDMMFEIGRDKQNGKTSLAADSEHRTLDQLRQKHYEQIDEAKKMLGCNW